jgi:hypothetical protein
MGMLSDYLQNYLIDSLFRGGAVGSGGAANSTVPGMKGIWTASTSYVVGDTVFPHASMTGAGGKFLRCVIAQSSGSTNTLAIGNPGSTVTDNAAAMWVVVSGVAVPHQLYVALLTNMKGARQNTTAYVLNDTIHLTANDGKIHYYKCTSAGTTAGSQSTLYPGVANEVITDSGAQFTEQTAGLDSNSAILVEASGTGYARVNLAPTLTNWAGTQSAASTTSSSGTLGTTSNNSAITFGTPTASWQPATGAIWGYAIFDQLTSGNLLAWAPLTTAQTVLNGQAAPSFAISALTMTLGN